MKPSGANLRFLLLILFSGVLINLDTFTGGLSPVRALLGFVVQPLQELVMVPQRVIKWVDSRAMSVPELRDLLDETRQQNLQLEVGQQQLRALEAENRRLRQLLSASPRALDRVMLAELENISLEPFSQHVLINRGLFDEVYEGQPVLDSAGVMGQVINTSYFKSSVALITDPGQTIPVMVERNGFRALSRGTGEQNRLDVPYLDRNTDIRRDDLLLTSGLGGRFPYGYPVAVVREVTVDVNEPFLRIDAEPVARLGYSREVLLVWPGELPKEEQPQDIDEAPLEEGEPGLELNTLETTDATRQ